MDIEKVEEYLRMYPRIGERVQGFTAKLASAREARKYLIVNAKYPQTDLSNIKTGETYKISDPTYEDVCHAMNAIEKDINYYSKEIKRLTDIGIALNKGLNILSGQEFDVIDFYYFRSYTLEKIAELIHLSESTVKRRRTSALEKIFKKLNCFELF